MLTKTETGTRQSLNWRLAGWSLGWLVALLALLYIYLLHPQTAVPLDTSAEQNSLDGDNFFVTIYRQGFGPLDPVDSSRPVEPGATLRAEIFSYRLLELRLDIKSGSGPLRIQANGHLIGTVESTNLAGSYRFAFTPVRPPDEKPEINLRFEAPATFRLSGLSLDLSEQWQPLTRPETGLPRSLAGLLLVLLAVIGLAALVFQNDRLGRLALLLAAANLFSLVWLLSLPLAVGPGGEMNARVYWGWLAVIPGLLACSLAFALAALPLSKGRSLAQLARPSLTELYRTRPLLSAGLALAGFNALLTALLFGVIYLQNLSLDNVARFWDGPEYLVIAHSFYDPADPLLQLPKFAVKSRIYWGAHFPLYPFLVGAVGRLTGYVPAMLGLSYVFGTAFALALYRFLSNFGYSRRPLWLAMLALFLPLRWLIYHSVGASEGLTLLLIVLCLDRFKRGNYWWAGLWGAGVVMTRPNGIFLYIGLGLFLLWQAWEGSRSLEWKTLPGRLLRALDWRAAFALSLMPLALLAVFALYGWRYGDFLAYLKIPEDVKHIYPLPLLSLDINVGGAEGDFYYYLLEAAGLYLLWQKRRFELFWPGLALTLPTVFLLHDDVLRYSLPAFPLVLLVPFASVLESRLARWLAPLALLGVLIYSWSQLNTNMVDLETWQAMLKILNS